MKNPLRVIRDHFLRDLINRINDLETGMRVLTESPAYRHDGTAGFNGLEGRKRIFRELVALCEFACLVETGTYLGDSTGYMASETRLPVFSGERNPRLYSLARMRLKDIPGITLFNLDSREFLLRLRDVPEANRGRNFFYLDAHWGKDVPLREEISIIASHWRDFVIMIDDFEVPGDSGYTHGDYGTLSAIGMPALRAKHDLRVYFPTIPSAQERPGAPGCGVVVRNGPMSESLDRIGSLRRHEG